jgi:hypothetical protein
MSDDSVPIVTTTRAITQQRSLVVTTPKVVPTALLTNSTATLYTTPSTTTPIGAIARAKLTSIVFCNTDSSARTVTLYLVASGGTAGVSNTILAGASIPAGKTWVFDVGHDGIPLGNGETIQGRASVTSVVSYRISVVEFL